MLLDSVSDAELIPNVNVCPRCIIIISCDSDQGTEAAEDDE